MNDMIIIINGILLIKSTKVDSKKKNTDKLKLINIWNECHKKELINQM